MTTRNIRTWKEASVLVVSTMLVLTTLFAAPAPVALADNTGYRSPTANAADTGGDGNGFEFRANRAYADDGGGTYWAESVNTCGTGGGCTERHRFYNYGFSIPADAVIQGIEVRADWWLDSVDGTNSLAVDLSWDSGTNWTDLQTDTTEPTSESTVIFGGAGNTWGRTWSPNDFTDAHFLVRVNITTDQADTRDFRLDWIAVQVTYNQPPAAPTNLFPASGAFTALGNPQFIWSPFSDPNPGDTQTNFQVQLRTQGGNYGEPDSQDSGSVASATRTYTPSSWNLGSGTYCWHVRVQDNSGASNAWSSYSTDTCFTVDRTAPTSAATSPDYDNGGSIAVDWTASDNAGGSGVSSVVLWYRLDAGAWTDSGMSQSGSAGTFDFDPPSGANGTYDFQTIATDVVGNVEADPAGNGHDSTVYDTTPPTSQATPPAGPINAPPIAIPWTADGAVSGIATDGILLRYNLNGNAYADGPTASGTSGTFDFTPPSGGGTYCFYTIATDNAGNVEAAPGGADGDGCTIFNTPPVAVDDGYSTPEDTPLIVAAPGVLTNDSDAEGDPLTAVQEAGPASGTLGFNADGSLVYTPTLDFNGVVTFTYHANDGMADSNTATVTITVTAVNDAPVAVDDGYSTPEDTPLTVAALGVLANDGDADGDALTAVREAGPASGTLVFDANGSFVYTPTLNFNGVVTFTYHANDGTADSNTATVTITVTPVNDAPVAVDDGYSTPEDTPLTVAVPGVLVNDSDADGDALTAAQEAGPASGTLAFNADGSFVYTPTLDFNGVVTFTYHANDGIADSNTATVTITVTPLSDVPVAVDDGYSTPEDTPLTVAAPGVLANDSDADGDALTAIQEAGPASGTVVLDADGSFVYTPTLNFNGVVTFTYHANDGTADSNTATVTITVTPLNDAPLAVDDGYSTAEDTPLTVAAPGILANDSDADSNPLTAVREAGPAGGTLVLNANGSFVYTPTLNFNGVVTFTYHASDGMANSNTATVTITVTALNDAPTFTSTPVTAATEEITYTYNVSIADVDNAVAGLTITAPTRPGWLTLTNHGDGTATLTGIPTHTDIGDHPVVLQVSDGLATTTQPFTITVSAKGNYYVYLPALFKNYQGSAR